jgi:ectoine hydroxylase-related dioxygenase (phytanoyl-CoA dioxygenase family)
VRVRSICGAVVDPTLVDESLAVDVVLAPGDVSVHHPNLIHGSGPNATERQRRALALRYRSGR